MKNVRLIKFSVKKIDFVNDTEPGIQMEIGNSYSYNVAYSKSGSCKGEFTATLTAKGMEEKFHIVVVCEGLFDYNPACSKDALHVETYDVIFPYVSSVVSTVTTNAGINPIYMPYIDISEREIYSFEKPE